MRAAVGLWARNELARRWKALVALGILAGLVGGLSVAAVAGARRTSTAYERFREATGRSDTVVFASGVAAGRWSWRWVADSTPLQYIPPLAASVVIASIPAALLLANAVALLPARRAARLRPADVLRAE